MKRVFAGGIALAAAITAAAFGAASSTPSSPLGQTKPSNINTDVFLDIPRFRISQATSAAKISGRPIAGVVNHHVLASDLLARFFSTLRAARPDIRRIVILSPDHFKSGDATISIGRENYASQGKNIAVDGTAVETLTRLGVAVTGSRRLFEREHGIGALVPFIAETFPEIKIVPIAIRADVNRSDAEKLGRSIKSLVDENTFILISSDMSHYLSEEDALAHDRETLSWLETLDADNFKKATDDNTDNGPSLVALSALFEKIGLKPTFRELDHSISSRYGGMKNNTTSYITGF